MVARQIFDELPVLPAAITCDTDPVDKPVEDSAKRKRSACSDCRARLSLRIARHLPMAWIGPKSYAVPKGATVPLALFESPCVFRQPAVEALERTQRPWRLAFTSPSLSGLWAAAVAGLGVTVRTTLGLPPPLTVLDKSSGLPKLPQIALSLYTAQPEPPQAVARLREILIEELPLRG